jgi:hypothetical protein
MKARPNYFWKAFNGRPFGMPIPPNWFGIAAFGMLGALVHPGLWLVGLGLEGLFLWMVGSNPRFRNAIDAQEGFGDSTSRYEGLLAHLDSNAQERQYEVEREAAEIVGLLQPAETHLAQISDVRQMAWLHLKLLAARASFVEVVAVAERERRKLEEQERSCRDRLASTNTDDELRRSLEQQLDVIKSRKSAHADAKRRLEIVDAELGRLRQQISLVREQALLATDENTIAHSLDALSASLNEANRWLKDQRELFAGIDSFTDEPPPADLLASKRAQKRASKVSE